MQSVWCYNELTFNGRSENDCSRCTRKITSVKGHKIHVVRDVHIYARAEYDEKEERYGELKAMDAYERFWLYINLMEVKNIYVGFDIIILEV